MKNDFKQTPLGPLPKTWEVVNFGDICEKSFYGTSNGTKESGLYPVLRMGNMQDGYINPNNLVYIDLDKKEFEKLQLKQGDILLNRTNSQELVGKISLFDLKENYICASYIVVYRLFLSLANPIFINNLLNMDCFQKIIKSFSTKGVSQSNINPTTFKTNLQIPLPPLKEQEKIAAILSAADEEIQSLEKFIKTKELYKKALMQKLFSRKLRFKEFKDEWKSVKLGEVIKHFGGKPLEKEVSKNGNYKFISIGNYSTEGKYIDNKQRVFLNNNTKDKLLTRGDLVMVLNDKTSDGKILGSTIYIDKDDEYIYNQRSERMICSKEVHPMFMWFLLNSANFRKQIFAISQGGTQIYVNFPSVKQITFSIPSLKEQEKIAGILSAIDEEIATLKKKFECLKLQKKALMQQLLSGKMRVKF